MQNPIYGRVQRWAMFFASGVGIGALAWGQAGSIWPLTFIVALPILWGTSRERCEGLLLMLGYYLAGARGLPGGASVFFGEAESLRLGLVMWAAASLLLSLPYMVCWSPNATKRALGIMWATVGSLLPPLAIVGWLNPLTVAGVLFPLTGWFGVLLTLSLFIGLSMLSSKSSRYLAGLAAIVVFANVAVLNNSKEVDSRWMGFDTSFPQLASAGQGHASQMLASIQRINWLTGVIADMPSDVTLVLPETILGRFDGLVQVMLSDAESELSRKNSRVLVGAELPLEGGKYSNALLVLGAKSGEDRAAVQGIPVPVSMWKPWADDGAHASFFGNQSSIYVGEHRIGVLICYEQLLAYSVLRAMWGKPEMIVAVSNVWWARSTNIPHIQHQSVQAFARLFGVPVVIAKNL